MNAYQTLARPWHVALDVWTVLARAQADFVMRMMGLPAPRARAAAPALPETAAAEAVAAPVVAEAPAEPRLTVVAGGADAPAPRAARPPRRARQSKRS